LASSFFGNPQAKSSTFELEAGHIKLTVAACSSPPYEKYMKKTPLDHFGPIPESGESTIFVA
jgi:hypothetical protein